jgi:peptidoglycan hydrolase CwlO-like protein
MMKKSMEKLKKLQKELQYLKNVLVEQEKSYVGDWEIRKTLNQIEETQNKIEKLKKVI